MPFAPTHFACWFEIPVTDLERARGFYAEVFGMELSVTNPGPNDMVDFPTATPGQGISGHLYPGKPAGDGSGPTIHLVVPDSLKETAARWTKAGGTILGPEIEIPPGTFQYALDLDGNSIGLFQMRG
jgi:predicted enzyme related to lactoylglutathione lyase